MKINQYREILKNAPDGATHAETVTGGVAYWRLYHVCELWDPYELEWDWCDDFDQKNEYRSIEEIKLIIEFYDKSLMVLQSDGFKPALVGLEETIQKLEGGNE